MKSIKIPYELKKMNDIFESNGFEAFLVGGAVRDMILGKNASDWDVATNAHPTDVQRIFHKVIPTGIAHGTVTVHLFGKEIEVTTYRCDHNYSDGRHPDSVTFAASIEDDLSRRDFTMNAIAASLKDGRIVDPFDGKGDIKHKIIRTVGAARERFLEDGLRPIRALRFSAQLNFSIEDETYAAIKIPEVQEKIQSISIERFRDELEKILRSDEPSSALHRMEDTGILKMFIPELAECRGCTQADIRGFHEFDVLDHNFYACDGAPKDNDVVRLAALFHDIGKKDARTVEMYENPKNSGNFVEIVHFHKHEIYSAEKTGPILFRLKFPNAVINKVVHLIKNHMFFFNDEWSDAAVRRFIVRIGRDNIRDLIDLWAADMYGMHRTPVVHGSKTEENIILLQERIRAVDAENSALSLKDLKVNGNDLMKIGIPAGKKLGYILNELFQCVLDDPEMNEREKLLTVAKNLNEN
ncbi:MAG: HD domain-containing protein [Treponema sp.]|nr:HD domain-containing protein [Treponema sp.]